MTGHANTLESLVIRRLGPTEAGRFHAHLLRLDAESRLLRFGMSVGAAFVADHARRAFAEGSAIYGAFPDGELRAAAELHPFDAGAPHAAEAAFSVEPAWRDRGLATKLLGRIILAARNRAIDTLALNCLPANKAMQKVAAKHGARLRFEDGGVVGRIVAPPATCFSLWREALEDNHGLAMAALELSAGCRTPLKVDAA